MKFVLFHMPVKKTQNLKLVILEYCPEEQNKKLFSLGEKQWVETWLKHTTRCFCLKITTID